MARTLDVARSEIRRDRLQRWDKMDITLLFGINFGRIRTRWKEKNHEDEAAMGQRGIEGGDDDEKQGLGP